MNFKCEKVSSHSPGEQDLFFVENFCHCLKFVLTLLISQRYSVIILYNTQESNLLHKNLFVYTAKAHLVV